MKSIRKRTISLIVALPLYLLCSISSLEAADVALKKIGVGYPSHSASMYPLYVTKEAGLFEKYGLESEMIFVQGVMMYQIHVAGEIDFSIGSGLVALQASVGGADLILIANSIENHLMKIMAHPGIKRPEDLKGGSVGISRFGSLTDLVARPVLKGWGLEPMKDVTLMQIGTQSDIATAVSLKKVDAGVLSFPTSLFAEKMGLKVLFDLAESGIEIPTTSVIVKRGYSNANRGVVLRFLKAYIEGTRRLFADRELGIRALRKYARIQDQDLLATTYDLFTSKYIKKVPTIRPKGVENALALIAETNLKAKTRKPGEFIDASFMEELEKSGFIKTVWR